VRPHRRTTLAATLVTVAVVLPTAAWYVSGTREARRRAASLEADALESQKTGVEREGDRLGSRLQALLSRESKRPFFHYQTLFHDPRGAAQGLSVTPSPLASGPADPLILAHFQINEEGLVTLPTVNERFPELSSDADFDALCTHLTELQNAVLVADGDEAHGTDEEQVLTLSASDWQQISDAESVYATITGQGRRSAPLPSEGAARVVVRISPFRWHTMVLGSGPVLAALRDVHTPDGVLIQGFTIASEAVMQWLGVGRRDLEFSPASLSPPGNITTLISDTGWVLHSDPDQALAKAASEGRAVLDQFYRTFGFTAAAVFLAAAAVLLILFETDRLAHQRARFAAAAAHELKTPLSSLMLHSQMLAESMGKPENSERYAAVVAAEAERMSRLVTNMLDLARLEQGALVAASHPGDLAAAVVRCVERLRPRLEKAGLAVETAVAPELPQARFDGDGLCQILDNLLDNAEKYTRPVADRRVTIRIEEADERVKIAVADNGPGIPRHKRRALFKAFSRLAEKGGASGLGLGLALARSLARAQGGDLELGDDNGTGANFVVTLPKA